MKDLEIPSLHYMLLGLAYHKNEVVGEYSTYRISFQNPVWKITTWGTKPFVKRFVHLNDPNSFSVKLILACSFSSAPHLREPYITVQIYFIPDLYCPSFKQAVFAS